jgi:hypothetical protein
MESHGPFRGLRVDYLSFLGHDNFAVPHEPASSFASRFHEGLPVAARGMATYEFGGLGGTDALFRSPFCQQLEDCCFQSCSFVASEISSALGTAIFGDIPIPRASFRPEEGSPAGLADLLFGGSETIGFALGVRHSLQVSLY